MRIALVSIDGHQGRGPVYYPPLHLCHLATTLSLNGYDVKIFDYSGLFTAIDTFYREIQHYGPDMIGMTYYTTYLSCSTMASKSLRKYLPKAAIVAGGYHPTVWPEWTLEKMPHVDYVMRGEGDRSILSLAEMLNGKRSEGTVPGLVYRKGNALYKNERDTIENLDELPQLDRRLLDKYYKSGIYWHMAARGKLDMMITSRGCPYDCTFCFKIERKYRWRSTEHLMIEFDDLKSRGITSIHILDDTFTANKERCLQVADALIKGNYGFELKVRSRVNSIDEEIIRKLKKAGVKQIVYGIESGSQKMLDSMGKKTTVAMNRRAIELTKNAGITCYADIMIGMPGETRETIDETISFLLQTKPIAGSVAVLYPLPQTNVYEEAKKNGTLQGDWTIEGPRPWVKLPWTKSKEDLEFESRRISKKTHRNIGIILYFLKHHFRAISWRQIKFLYLWAKVLLHA